MEEATPATSNYNKRPIWQWIVLYLAIAVVLYAAFYYLFLSKNNGGNYNSQTPTNTLPTQSATTIPQTTNNQITVTLDEENNSGELGTATLKEENGKTTVTISLTGFTEGVSQPAHIHVGSCPGVGAVKYPLTNVIDGNSVTEINATFDDLKSQLPLALNVHKSAAEVDVYTGCGDLSSE